MERKSETDPTRHRLDCCASATEYRDFVCMTGIGGALHGAEACVEHKVTLMLFSIQLCNRRFFF